MAHQSQQVARILEQVLRASRGKIGPRWVIAALLLVGGYLLVEPLLEVRLGVDLPGAHSPSAPQQTRDSRTNDTGSPRVSGGAEQQPELSTAERLALDDVLEEVGPDTFRSPAGLIYTRGSVHGHRLKHLMSHAQDEPDRPGQHGVFDQSEAAELVQLVDEAYLQAVRGRNSSKEVEGDRTVYTVNLERRIGYIGGQSGSRRGYPAARHVRLVVDGERFITAFPVRP